MYHDRHFTPWNPEKSLETPLRWRKVRFVEVVSDLFHPSMPFEFIDKVFAVMAYAHQHTFMILTKRPERMKEYVLLRREALAKDFLGCDLSNLVRRVSYFMGDPIWVNAPFCMGSTVGRDVPKGDEHLYTPENTLGFPTPNVWLGTSVENQEAADKRIPHLLETPAAVRFLSCEPLLGPLRLDGWLSPCSYYCDHGEMWPEGHRPERSKVDWVITGGESGNGARPMHPDWARSLRDQCSSAGVPFFFKQHGEYLEVAPERAEFYLAEKGENVGGERVLRSDVPLRHVGKKRAGRLLDGREHNEVPEVAR